MSHHRRSLKEIPKTNIPLAKDSLDTARSDLKSAKALYDSELYPTAIYHLQQSIEKGWKSFGFYYGIITEGQARSRDIIGHKGSKVCNRTITVLKKVISHMRSKVKTLKHICSTEQTEHSSAPLQEDFLKELDGDIDTLVREVNNITANEEEIRKMPYDDMNDLIEFLTAFQKSLIFIEEMVNSPKFSEEYCEAIRQGAYRTWRPIFVGVPYADNILKKTLWEKLDNETIRKMMIAALHGMMVTVPLFQLAIITQVHEQTTRYRLDGISPTVIYTTTHPLIQLFPSIYSLTEETLTNLERLYDEMPPGKEVSP